MRNFLFTIFLVVFSLHSVSKDGFKILSSDPAGVTIEYTFQELKKKKIKIGEKDYYYLWSDQTVPLLNKGFPEVLRSSVSLAIPENCKPVIEILEKNSYVEKGWNIAPSKGSLTRDINPSDVPYTFGPIYSENRFYPEENVTFGQFYDYRHVKGVSLSVFPVRYNPVISETEIITRIVFRIHFYGKNKKIKFLGIPEYHSVEEKNFMESRFANLSGLSSALKTNYTPLNEFGDMLIISDPSHTSAMLPFIDWKNQKGIKTEMVTTIQTGTSSTSVKNFISNYYSTHPNLLYVLLVGDHQNIPAYNDGIKGSEIKYSDSKYGMITGNDYYPELMVGRFSSTLTADIQTMVNRTLEYEKNPSSGNWYTYGIGIGSNEGYGIGDEGEPDWLHERKIGQKLVSGAGYTYYHEFFDSTHGGNDAPGDPTPAMVSAAVNQGASVFFYTGHGSQNSCGTSGFSSSSINACTNNGKYPFSVQVACNNGTFHNGTCFCETFLIAKNSNGPTGAIASCGSSILMAWAEPMDTQDEIGDILSNQYANNKKFTLGGLFYNGQMHMLDNYPTTTGQEVMATWIMFGDPSCMIRTQTPSNLTVNHDTCIFANATSFPVQVNPGPNTYICITQNNQIIGRTAVSSSLTSVSLTQTFSPSQPLLITVTEFNKIPYTSTIGICTGTPTSIGPSGISSNITYNSSVTDELHIVFNSESVKAIKIHDMQGKLIGNYTISSESEKEFRLDMSRLSPGVYLLSVYNENDRLLLRNKIVKH
jgi:gingipain R